MPIRNRNYSLFKSFIQPQNYSLGLDFGELNHHIRSGASLISFQKGLGWGVGGVW